MLRYLRNPLHARRFHLYIWVKSLRHCLIYQRGALCLQQFYPSFFDADEFVDLFGFAVKEFDDLDLFLFSWYGNLKVLNDWTQSVTRLHFQLVD